jgi:hypothetical protein
MAKLHRPDNEWQYRQTTIANNVRQQETTDNRQWTTDNRQQTTKNGQ